jgi:hypothetical protein
MLGALAIVALAAPWLVAWLLPAFAQPQSYHDFADQRALSGLPHAANVLSNFVFLLIGVAGLAYTTSGWTRTRPQAFACAAAARPFQVLFAGTALTAFGSAWYHLDPNDATLIWDRLPIALGFSGLVAGVLADRAPGWASALTAALAVTACGTVLYWATSGNLLPYLAMQAVYVGVALAATTTVASRYTHARWIYGAAALYVLALAAERYDHELHTALAGAVSGHTVKHLIAAAAIAVVYAMLRLRRIANGRDYGA